MERPLKKRGYKRHLPIFIFLSVPRNVVMAFQYIVSVWLAQPRDR